MDWNAEIENDRDMLKRIVALLLAFAGLADRASVMPGPVRAFVLWLLRQAEIVAQDFVTATVWRPGASALQAYASLPMDVPSRHTEAVRLAFCFRTLALVLTTMLAQARRFAQLSARSCVRQIAPARWTLKPTDWRGLFILVHPSPDTS